MVKSLYFYEAGTEPDSIARPLQAPTLEDVVVINSSEELVQELHRHPCQLVILDASHPEFHEVVQRVARLGANVRLALLRTPADSLRRPSDVPDSAVNPPPAGTEEGGVTIPSAPLRHLSGDMRRALEYLHAHVFDPSLSLGDVAAQVPVSRFHFSRLFKQQMGVSFREYLTRLRLRAARQLLAQGRSVTEVCFTVGYNDLTHFGRQFRKEYGTTPSWYRSWVRGVRNLPPPRAAGRSSRWGGAST